MHHLIFKDIKCFKSSLLTGSILGIDLGTKRIGISVSDENQKIAFPMKTIIKTTFLNLWKDLEIIIKEKEVKGVVVGYPIEMSGKEGSKCQSTRAFCENIIKEIELPIYLQDERLSSAGVNRMLIDEADVSREKRKLIVDKLASTLILQTALDSLFNISN